jgi:phosphoribosyl 1,2-cyclic phosphodiesterase
VLKRKISSVVQRIKPDDLKSAESKELFLSSLPESLFGTVGGHTSCVEIRLSDDTLLVFDCGSGLKSLEEELLKSRKPVEIIHIFFSHFHYDHLSGLPYFHYFFDSSVEIFFYSPDENLKAILDTYLKSPYHPIGLDAFSAKMNFIHLKGRNLKIKECTVSWILRNHPDACYAYSIEENGKKIIYSTDTELTEADFKRESEIDSFFKKADAIILDGQYTLEESIEKNNWGHTSYSMSVDFAIEHEIARLYLFHHEPMSDDMKLEAILRSSRWYSDRAVKKTDLKVYLAREDHEVVI